MKKDRRKLLGLLLLCAFCCISCNETNKKSATINNSPQLSRNDAVIELPDAPGKKAYQTNCISCHSARYVQMQPNLPEKTWLALVQKMKNTFGAPIADSSVNDIVLYLVAIKSKS